MERQQVFDEAIFWLSLLSIATICLLMLYNGIKGLAHVPATDFSPMKKAFGVTVFILFIVLPLMILNLVLDTAFISRAFEWSMSVIYMAIVVDIVLMTVFYLIM